jgi:hypothetical protein
MPDDLSMLRLFGIDLLPPRDDELEALVKKDERRPRRKLPVRPPPATSAMPTTTTPIAAVNVVGSSPGASRGCTVSVR